MVCSPPGELIKNIALEVKLYERVFPHCSKYLVPIHTCVVKRLRYARIITISQDESRCLNYMVQFRVLGTLRN